MLENRSLGVVFPGCGIPFTGTERPFLSEHHQGFGTLLERAWACVGFDPEALHAHPDGAFEGELEGQYATYVLSCALSDWLKDLGLSTACAAGYSMGLYAALYHGGSYRFEDGLRLIERAYQSMQKSMPGKSFGMGAIVGLSPALVTGLIRRSAADAEIINVTSDFSMVVSGGEGDVLRLLDNASAEGALKAIPLPLRIPYHSSQMTAAALEFRKFVSGREIRPPSYPLFSAVDQSLLESTRDVVDALTANLHEAIDWRHTMRAMLEAGVGEFVECGPGSSLKRLGRFLGSDVTIHGFGEMARWVEARGGAFQCDRRQREPIETSVSAGARREAAVVDALA